MMPRPAAEQTMARAGKTFFQAARLLPHRVRSNVIALYAFCRTVDDLADEPSQPLADRRAALHRLLDTLEGGSAHALREAGWSLGADPLKRSAAAILVRAAIEDLHQCQPATEDDVLAYAFGVAGSVGILMAQVLQAQRQGYGAAVALGCAMQLSNICRDVAEDARQGRVYLPADLVTASTLQQAFTGQNASAAHAVRVATQRLLARADRLYQAAYDGMWTLPWRIRWSILAAALCYREIGVRVGLDIDRSWRERTIVSRGRKLQLIALAGLRLLHPRFWWPRSSDHWSALLGSSALRQARLLGVAP